MIHREQKLTIAEGTGSEMNLWISDYAGSQNNVYIVTNLEGWDGGFTVKRNASEPEFEDGIYYSTAAKIGSKIIDVEVSVDYPDATSLRVFKTQLTQLLMYPDYLYTASMTYYEDQIEVRKETLGVIINDDFFSDWKPIGQQLVIPLSLLAPSPWKTLYLNGSTIPEDDKIL